MTTAMVDTTSWDWLFKAANLSGTQIEPTSDVSIAWDNICTESGLSHTELANKVADFFQTEFVRNIDPSPSTVQLVPESVARQHCMIPVSQDQQHMKLAVADPTNREAIQQASFSSGRSVEAVIGLPAAIQIAIDEKYKESGELASVAQLSGKRLNKEVLLVRGRVTTSALTAATQPTEKLFLLILKEAVNQGASDIHIQPFVGGAAARLRIDGVMQQLKSMPMTVLERLIRHVKAIADLDITNNRTPQDGRLTLVINDEQRDLRLSILPVEQGERLVIRLLAHGALAPGQLNFEEEQSALFRKAMRSTSGMVLVTGPTGSGKTTTLYAMLNLLNHDTSNIMSVEDPVEIRMRGVSQSSVNPEQGLTFPSVLRSMLRQDPDVILVGEVRDTETAELALRASLTGHLVLSTLHTIDAVTTIPRLLDLGLSPILIADALLAVINQRLVRKNCEHCKISVSAADANDLEMLYLQLSGRKNVWRSTGCDACSHDGYAGRIPVGQVWALTDDVRNMLRRGETDHEALSKIASDHGLQSLSSAGFKRIDDGLTTVEEVARVLGANFWSALGSEGHSVLETMGRSDRVSMHEKLLIVEPNETLRNQLITELESREYVVTAVASREEAVAVVERGEPLDLLLLDIDNENQTPLQSFNDLAGSLSMLGLSRVLMLPTESEAVETLLEAYGASDYLIKPVGPQRVADLVEAVLKRRHL